MRKSGKKLAGLLAGLSLFQGSKSGAKFVHEPIMSGVNFYSKNKMAFSTTSLKRYIPIVASIAAILAASAYAASEFYTKSLVKIKFRFAGSGDLLWRKAFKNPNVDNEYVTSNSNCGSAFYEFGKLFLEHSKDKLMEDLRNFEDVAKHTSKITQEDVKKAENFFGFNNNLKILTYDQSTNKYLLYEVNQDSKSKDATKSWCAVDDIYRIRTTNLEDKNEKFDEINCDTPEELTRFISGKCDNILEYFNSVEEKEFHKQLKNQKIKEINDLNLAKMLQKYGKLLKLEHKLKNETREVWVWKKEVTKTKKLNNDWLKSKIHQIEFTIPGPQDKKGVLDMGQFSIIRNIENGYFVLENEINEYLGKGDKIHVSVKGHSRGGVAANIVLNEIVNKFGNNNNIEFSSVAFDPVPGNSIVSNTGWLNIGGVQKKHKEYVDEYSKTKLNNEKNSAVIYTLKSDYETLGLVSKKAYVDFQPQKIFNSKVTIISEINSKNVHGVTGHGVGTQLVEKDENSGKFHKRYFHFEGKKYSQGNLWQLPAGLYWVGNDFKLKKMDGDKNKEFTEGKLKFIEKSKSNEVDTMRKEFLETLIKQHMK
ncbi:MAG: hypothetical protein IJQ10_03890 [Clostridia bacterium]|nr:hypothetical protein [Clostridia bacterium]